MRKYIFYEEKHKKLTMFFVHLINEADKRRQLIVSVKEVKFTHTSAISFI